MAEKRANDTARRRIHGELLVPGITIAASTLREIPRQAGTGPAPGRTCTTEASFLRSQAGAPLARGPASHRYLKAIVVR